MAFVEECLAANKPLVNNIASVVYGIKRLVPGRLTKTIQGIVLHNLGMDLPAYDARMRTRGAPGDEQLHASVHYAIGLDGNIRQYVDDDDIAWGFQTYNGSFPSSAPDASYPGWTVLPGANAGVSADLYVLHVGLAIPPQLNTTEYCDPCSDGRLSLNEDAYRNLVQLVAYLKDEYSVPVDAQHLAAHQDIQELSDQEFAIPCWEESCFLCDVEAYCQTCANKADPSFLEGSELAFIYGETVNGCKVKISIEDLITLMAG